MIKVSPFACTHYYIRGEIKTDHGHEFTRYWGIVGLEGQELLEACAGIYDHLDALTRDTHRRAGADMPSYEIPGSTRALPCMVDVITHRTVRTSLRDGDQVWRTSLPVCTRPANDRPNLRSAAAVRPSADSHLTNIRYVYTLNR